MSPILILLPGNVSLLFPVSDMVTLKIKYSLVSLVENANIVSCQLTPQNDMLATNMPTHQENGGNFGPTCYQILLA